MHNKTSKLLSVIVILVVMFANVPGGTTPVQAMSADLVISQVYGGAGCGTVGCSVYKNDYIEIFNRGAASVSLSGLSVQYASATGSFNAVVATLSGSLAPGQYYLVAAAFNANGVNTLPTPDVTGTTAMSATAGKVALVTGTTALACGATGATPAPCSSAQLAQMIDLVGFGTTANMFEGSAPTPAPSTTNAVFRGSFGCTESDSNSTDFTAAAAAPRNSAATLHSCGPVLPTLSINDVTLAEGNSGTPTLSFTISLSAAAPTGGVTFDIATADNSATVADNDYVTGSLTNQTIAVGNDTYTFVVTVNGDTTVETDETFYVNVTNVSGATVGDGQGLGTITNDDISPTPDLSIDDVTQNEGDSGTTTFTFTVSLSAPAPTGGVTFDIATGDNTATIANNDYITKSLTVQTIPSGNSSYSFDVLVNGDTTVEANETFYVNVTNVTGANVSDGQGLGTITNDDVLITFIHDIQGSGATSISGTYTVDAIVVGDYQTQGSGQLRGFFIQEEDSDVDADPATSEGIFVFCSSCPTPVSIGDKVRVTGTSSEYFQMSQLNATSSASVSIISSGNPLPAPVALQLPVPGVPTGNLTEATNFINAHYEAFEGMLVTFPATLSVSEYFELARYGQVILTAGGRPRMFTDANIPTAGGYIDHEIGLAGSTIILDDTDNRQNRPVDSPNTAYYHPVPGLSISNYFRGGDTITNLTGVLHWSFAGLSGTDAWRIRPVTEAYSYAFTPVNTRPAIPTVSGSLKVTSFNVLNYFLTIDTTNVCAPTLNQDCRGADSTQELTRQRTKMLAALSAINADVFGFMEMENTPGVEPLADIVAGLPGYGYIDTGVIGTDAIRVGIIYKTSTVQPIGNFAILDSSVDPNFNDTRNRPALAQTFEQIATGERFTVVVNHLKSKGSACGAGDDDTTTGQGNCNVTRTLAAQALADWLATDPTDSGDPDMLIIGDLNSYAMEDPIVALETAGYTNLVNLFGGSDAYGYVFDGQLGYLDHALANSSLNPQVAGVAEWHINADEIPLFDYNDDARTADEASFEEESDVLPLYEPNEFRTSDHDPILIGLNLDATPPTLIVPDDMLATPTGPTGAVVNFIVTATDNVDPDPTVVCVPPSGSTFPIGVTIVNCTATDDSGNVATDSFTITVGGTTYTLRIRSNGSNDGTLRESSELSGFSNWAEPTNHLIAVGDDYLKRQYVGILDFDTSALPDNAVVTGARLQVKVMVLSTNVYTSLGNLLADVTRPHFGTLPSLETMDFRFRALAVAGAFTKATDYNQWIALRMKSTSLFAINRIGQTQFRVRFALDDNNDTIKQQIGFLSGDYFVLSERPLLVITYYLP